MDYTTITPADQSNIVKQRLAQTEADHYQHQLNLDNANSWPDDAVNKQQAIQDAEKAMAELDAAHAALLAELENLTPQAKK